MNLRFLAFILMPSVLLVSEGCERNCLPIDIEVLWTGYYEDSRLFLYALDEEDIGPTVTAKGRSLTVTWLAMVYEDCREPDGFCISQIGQEVYFNIEDLDERQKPCVDMDYVANVSASTYISSGSYSVIVSSSVQGYGARNGPEESFNIEIE